MRKVPILNIPNLSDSSEDDVLHECIRNINILYEQLENQIIINSDELKYYNKLYDYKKKLSKKIFHFILLILI